MVSILVCHVSSAQNHSYTETNWLFGDSESKLIFNKSDARAQLDSGQFTPYGTGGGIVISNPITGDLIFYSDGQRVYDAYNVELPSAGLLNGDASLNSSAVVWPLPYSSGEYYVFTNSGSAGVNEIQYTQLDRDLVGNAEAGEPFLGDAMAINQPTGLTNPSDAMLIVKQDVDNYWLITQDNTTDEYRVTALNSLTGIGATTTYLVSTDTTGIPDFEASALAYDQINSRIAVAPKDDNNNVYILNFDVLTGALSFSRSLLNTGNSDAVEESIYDIEWSVSGDQLYISRYGDNAESGNLYQVDLNDTFGTVNSILFSPVFRSYGLKRGPDENIYHLYQLSSADPIEIGVILESDSTFHADSTAFNVGYDSLFFGQTDIEATQFPSFAEPHFEAFDVVGFGYLDTCATLSTKFYSMVEPTPQSYLWDFGTGDTYEGVAPVYTFAAAGTYTVSLTVSLNDIDSTFSTVIEVLENDLMIDLGMDTVRCPGETWELDAGEGGLTYAWSTGDSTQTITADTTSIYSVAVVSEATGCMNYAYVQITTYEDDSQFRNQWYFGEMAGIDFNDPDGTVAITDDNLINSPQASSSVSDLNGNLLFYTDGETVWNKEHGVMINGDVIGGDNTSMQGAMIVPLPGDSSIYYIFTSDPVYGDNTYDMRYSIVDMRRDFRRGEVIAKGIPFFTNSTERIAGFGLGENLSWLVTHEFGNNQFRSYELLPTGIGAPATSSTGSIMRLDEEKMATGEMQVSESGAYIALAIQDTDDNFIELFGIDDSTGVITQIAKIDIEEPAPSLVYGIEFASGDDLLYVSTNSNGSKLLQYSLDSIDASTAEVDIMASKFEVSSNASLEYGAIQTGADGVVYMAIDGRTAVGTINVSTSDDSGVTTVESVLVEDGFDLSGRTSRLGLPNFVQDVSLPSMQPGIAYDNGCLGQETIFDGSGTSIIDNYLWTFDDGTSAAVEDTAHVYNLSGIYNVSLNVTNRCGLDTTFLEAVEIFEIPSEPTLEDAVTICNGPIELEAWPVDTVAFAYTWSTGEDTRQITVSESSIVNVFITDVETGCQSDPAESFVDDTSPIVDLGPDQFLCQNEAFPNLDAANPGSSYIWTLEGVDLGNSLAEQEVATDVIGIFTYTVEVTDIFECRTIDEIVLTVEPMPNFTFTTNPTSGCNATDGDMSIDIIDAGSFTYEITGPVDVGVTSIGGPTGLIPVATDILSGGAYAIDVTNTVTGCANIQTATVADGDSFNSSFTANPDCPGDGSLDINLTPSGSTAVPATVNYELYDEMGNLIIPTTTAAVSGDQFTINNLDSGSYSLVIEGLFSGFECISTIDNIELGGNEVADFIAQSQFICGTEGRIGISPVVVNGTDPVLYAWTGPDIIGTAQGDSITVGSGGIYQVTASTTGYCDYTQDIEVTQNDLPDIAIGIIGGECDGSVILEAAITSTLIGNPAYSWSTGQVGSQLPIIASGLYEVVGLDQSTGCTNLADTIVDVFDEITVFIAADPNCDDNAEVFLSAYANITEDVTFTWVDGSGVVLDEDGAEISIGESGNYNVTVASILSSCSADASIDVAVVPITDEQLLLPASDSFCSIDPNVSNNQVSLDPGSFTSYEWTIVNDTEILSTDRIYITSEAGIYEVLIGNGFTCLSDLVEVYDNCEPLINAPNAFAPNGVNSTFFVYPNDYVTDFEIKIFSRWGEQIYYSDNIDFRWDGYFDGVLSQQGTYAYVLTYRSLLNPDRGEIEQRGAVLLLR